MTWEQEQEQAYQQEQIKERARLEQEIEKGRRYSIAFSVLADFVKGQREKIISQLEDGNYKTQDEINGLLAWLRITRNFETEAKAFVSQGRLAEREIADAYNDGEDS